MKSYPSTFNYGGSNLVIPNKMTNASDFNETQQISNMVSRPTSFDISRIKSVNIGNSGFVKSELLRPENVNATEFNMAQATVKLDYNHSNIDTFNSGGIQRRTNYENPLNISASNIRSMNNYRFMYNKRVKTLVDAGKIDDNNLEVLIGQTATTASIFNPINNIQILGVSGNVPMLNNVRSNIRSYDSDITNCSIRKLVWASLHNTTPSLGNAKYRYADFMYCKDLGKVSNNHLITLRRFPLPVGDNIFETSSGKYSANKDYNFDQFGSTGTLISWFGTDDNKLEDILSFSYKATWKPLEAKIQPVDTREDSENRGWAGWIANSVNPNYNKMVGSGFAGRQSVFGYLATALEKFGLPNASQDRNSDNQTILTNYDQNKVYTPTNTIQDTHIYEGKLIFSHEFTLNFSYKLRAYDNINPKSAFIDLIGNILEVTYRRGKFWGGDRKWIGPEKNTSTWNKANALMDDAWEKLGGFTTALLSGSIDWGNIMSSISGAITEMAGAIYNGAKQLAGGKGLPGLLLNGYKKLDKATAFGQGLKGVFKNMFGRPALYALDSLLSGDDVGVWHVTIGNPFNPIAAMGNLILTDANISFAGPLGIDDFPSEIKVKVSLKHARSRDTSDIGRMFTRGESSIYMQKIHNKKSDHYDFMTGHIKVDGKDVSIEDYYNENKALDQRDILEASSRMKDADGYVINDGVKENLTKEITEEQYNGMSPEEQANYHKGTIKLPNAGIATTANRVDNLGNDIRMAMAQDAFIDVNTISGVYDTGINTPNAVMFAITNQPDPLKVIVAENEMV